MSETPPTVVLVHGAFADASSWNGVIERLQARASALRPLPTRCAASPATALTSPAVLEQIAGPVVAVGHSYGGAVITNAATARTNVVGLVYVAAFAPEEGETLGEAGGTRRTASSVPRLSRSQYPTATADRRPSSPSTRPRPVTPSPATSPTRRPR